MSRTLVLAAVVLAATAPLARGDDPKPPATPLERIEALQKEMNQKLTALQAEVAALKAQVARVDTTQNVLIDTWEMRNQIEGLQAEVTRLREQLAAAKRSTPPSVAPVPPSVSNTGPATGGFDRMPDAVRNSNKMTDPTRMAPPSTSLKPALGTFRIINNLARTMVVRVNGNKDYVIEPGDATDVPVSPGNFSYQVMGIDPAPRTMSAVAGKVAAITIHP